MLVGFYCTMIRDSDKGERVAWLLGPFKTKPEAEAKVSEARRLAEAVDPRAFWDRFGVTRVETRALTLPYGRLNERAGFPCDKSESQPVYCCNP